ncbi:unnamed protein product [Schistosoma mattheei]|uniref:Uncharacterized protein n=1 Tax=Schistosoma mattheei TaxID=31246 RepID=A0A3P8HL84_9TREM|nr:unnamed protein product [Schistosoma mattheei]
MYLLTLMKSIVIVLHTVTTKSTLFFQIRIPVLK